MKQWQEQLEEYALHISITPIRKGTVETLVNQALVERFDGVDIAEIQSIRATPHYRTVLRLE